MFNVTLMLKLDVRSYIVIDDDWWERILLCKIRELREGFYVANLLFVKLFYSKMTKLSSKIQEHYIVKENYDVTWTVWRAQDRWKERQHGLDYDEVQQRFVKFSEYYFYNDLRL